MPRVTPSQRDGSIIAALMSASVRRFSDPVVTRTFGPRAGHGAARQAHRTSPAADAGPGYGRSSCRGRRRGRAAAVPAHSPPSACRRSPECPGSGRHAGGAAESRRHWRHREQAGNRRGQPRQGADQPVWRDRNSSSPSPAARAHRRRQGQCLKPHAGRAVAGHPDLHPTAALSGSWLCFGAGGRSRHAQMSPKLVQDLPYHAVTGTDTRPVMNNHS